MAPGGAGAPADAWLASADFVECHGGGSDFGVLTSIAQNFAHEILEENSGDAEKSDNKVTTLSRSLRKS